MKYTVRRFSYQEALKNGSEYISAQVDNGLDRIEDLSTRITEDPRLRDLRPVKRHVGLVKNVTKILKKKKKKNKSKTKDYSDSTTDPTISMNTSEANKFKTALGRLSNSMTSDSQSLIE